MHKQIRRDQRRQARDVLLRPLDYHEYVRRCIKNDMIIPFIPQYDMGRTLAGVVTKRPSYNGPAAKEKAKASTSVGSSATTALGDINGGGTGDGGGGDDGDGGDGDGDGPRRRTSSHHTVPRSAPRATRRSLFPKLLTRRAFAWLLTLSILLAYLAPPSFAALFIQLGQPELAKEMLRYQPRLLMPLPSGWSTSS